MGKKIDPTDIVNLQFGHLTVLGYLGKRKKYHFYLCKCSCGRETEVERNNLRSGHTTTCGFCNGKKCEPEDIIGKRFEMLVPDSYHVNNYGTYIYDCLCDCGRHQEVPRSRLLSGKTKSCAYCAGRKADFNDIVGKRFGSLTVLDYAGKVDGKNLYRCRCDCGKEKLINRNYLLSGDTRSCGDCSWIEEEEGHYRYHCEDGDSWIFDVQDLELVRAHKWYISHDGYPHTKENGEDTTFHRLVFGLDRSEIADHIDGNPRNNLRSNLRPSVQSVNTRNQRIKSSNTSGYKGVSYSKTAGLYEAYINNVPYTKTNLGFYDTPEEAARAYDEAARFYFGEFACVNFPLPGEQGCRRNLEVEKQAEVA